MPRLPDKNRSKLLIRREKDSRKALKAVKDSEDSGPDLFTGVRSQEASGKCGNHVGSSSDL
jgi:hypothetical protein